MIRPLRTLHRWVITLLALLLPLLLALALGARPEGEAPPLPAELGERLGRGGR